MPPACLPPAQPRRRKRMPMTCYVCACSPLQTMHASMLSEPPLGAMPQPAHLPSVQPLPPNRCTRRGTYVLVRLFTLAGAPHQPRRARRASLHESAGRFAGSDDTAAVDVESPRRNANKKLKRTTSHLAYESQDRKSRRVQAPRFGANPGKAMPCRALPTVPRNAQRPRPQIFTACRH